MFKNRKRKGFTLIELVIVIAIIGILAAIAVPKFTSSTQKARNAKIEANARTIASAFATDYAVKGKWATTGGTDGTSKIADILAGAGLSSDANKYTPTLPTGATGKIKIVYSGGDYSTDTQYNPIGTVDTGTNIKFEF